MIIVLILSMFCFNAYKQEIKCRIKEKRFEQFQKNRNIGNYNDTKVLLKRIKELEQQLVQHKSDKKKNKNKRFKHIPGLPKEYHIKSKRIYHGKKLIKYNEELSTGPEGYIKVEYNSNKYTDEQIESLKNLYYRFDKNNQKYDICHIKPQCSNKKRKKENMNSKMQNMTI